MILYKYQLGAERIEYHMTTKYFQIRISKKNKEQIQKKADYLNISLSDYVRLVALNIEVPPEKFKKIPDTTNKDETIQTPISEIEKEKILNNIRELEKNSPIKITISDYIIFIALKAKIKITV